MYFRKYRLQKKWLDKCLKSRVSEALRQRTWQIGENMVPISMTAFLQKLLITLKVNSLETVSFSDTQNPKTVC